MNTELAPNLNLSARDFETRLYSTGRNLDALSAFSALLDIAVMHDPGILQSSDSGLAYLLDRHIGDIRETSDQLEQYRWRLTQFEELKEALSNDLGRLEADHQDRKDRAEERLRPGAAVELHHGQTHGQALARFQLLERQRKAGLGYKELPRRFRDRAALYDFYHIS